MVTEFVKDRPSLLTRYETLRRKESERLNALLDTLGRVDGLPADQMEQARDALFHADHPYLMVLLGAFNTGKSSIINALIGDAVLEIGAIPTTTRIAIVRHGPAHQRMQAGETETIFYPHPWLEKVSIVDTPGLESVFKGHDDITRKFLHRADLVVLVMLSTQAMSASNVGYLQSLRAYGKRVIIVINQIDLVEPEQHETLRTFVQEQSKQHLGIVPDIWLLSARQALDAQRGSPRDEAGWQASGFSSFDHFINRALSDAERVRQKLETPLQITRNVMQVALATVREQQDALADHRRSADNVNGQMEAGLREQRHTLRDHLTEIDETFAEAISRGREAIGDTFQWSRGVRLAIGGVFDVVGLGRLFRRFGAVSPAKAAFDGRKVNEPLNRIPEVTERIGPRLEGRDVKDVDDLITYARREMDGLPATLQGKVIGTLQPPVSYDRAIMRDVRGDLRAILDKARDAEFQRIDAAVRNAALLLGIWEAMVFVLGVIAIVVAAGRNDGSWVIFLVLTFLLMFGGLLLTPIRGKLLERGYARRMRAIKEDYLQQVEKTASKQIEFGRQLRLDAVAPFMRLVDSQITQIDGLKKELETHQQALTGLEKELGLLKD